MPATLNIQLQVGSVSGIEGVVRAAFDAWLSHFDYTAGRYDINLFFGKIVGDLASNVYHGGDAYVQIGSSSGMATALPIFGLNVTGRNGPTPITPPLNFTVNQYGSGDYTLSNLLREFEHALGVQSFLGYGSGSLPAGSETVYDGSVLATPTPPAMYASPYLPSPGLTYSFTGPNAQAVLGGPVPLAAPNETALSGDQGVPTVNTHYGPTTYPPPATPPPLDVAMLRDAGLPALTDQEVAEHQIARLYFAAYGRIATGAELTASTLFYNTFLAAGGSAASILGAIGTALASNPAMSNLSTLSDAGFVQAIFQNTFGRAADSQTLSAITQYLATSGTAGRGAVLFALTDLDEARGRLSANPNVTYAGTVEAQTARLYDTAFGRAADPGGFAQYTKALINGLTLKQAAASFLQSGEFASRYGASPSDQALVDGLYQNTLGRAPDAAGEAQYLRALASGTFSRADLVVGFSESSEHIALMAQRVSATDAAGHFLDTQTPLGLIPVLSGTDPYPPNSHS